MRTIELVDDLMAVKLDDTLDWAEALAENGPSRDSQRVIMGAYAELSSEQLNDEVRHTIRRLLSGEHQHDEDDRADLAAAGA